MDRNLILHTVGMPTASEFQADIFEFVQEQINRYLAGEIPLSLLVQAVAGAGKTTTVVAMAKLFVNAPKKLNVLFLAFNKSIAEELAARLPKEVDAMTLNSLGYRAWLRYSRAVNLACEIDSYKTHKLVRELFSRPDVAEFGDDVRTLVARCKALGVVPDAVTDAVSMSPLNFNAALDEICVHFGQYIQVNVRPHVYDMVRRVLTASLANERVIDFDDQKYLTVVKRPGGVPLQPFKYDVVIIDEVQDVNDVDIALIRMCLKPNGIAIGVGDENQSIYGFRGADARAVEKFCETFNAKKMPLSITYRCSKAVVAHAQELVPAIQHAPNAPEGAVQVLDVFSHTLFNPSDMILCRNNAPLVSFAFKLIARRVPVFVKGRDIGRNLISIIEKLVGKEEWVQNGPKKAKVFTFNGSTVQGLSAKLQEWAEQQKQILLQANPDDLAGVEAINDKVDTIRVFLEANHDNKVESVVADINSLFDIHGKDQDDAAKAKKCVVMSSVHRAKGLEADRVYVLDYDKTFYPKRIRPDTWQYQQEQNIDYVARTRSRTFYGYITSEGLSEPEENVDTK